MGAFQSGFQMGAKAFQDNLDNKDRAGIRKRQEEEFQWRVEDRARQSKDREGIDTAIKSFQATQGGIYDGTQAKFDSPMTGGEMGPQMEPSMPNPAMGLKPRAPTALETNQGLAGIAGAQRDVNAMGTLAKEAGTLRIDQQFKDYMAEYKAEPEQIGSTIQYVNGNSKALTMGNPDKNGLVRMSIVTPDKNAEFIKLTKQDQAQLYAAGKIMVEDPKRALEIMSKINGNMAAAFAAENGLTKFLADNTNDVSAKGASMSNDAARTRIAAAAAGDARAARNKPQWVAMEDGQGGVRYVDMNAVPSKGGIAVLPEGTRPARKPVDQKAAVDMATKLVESGMADPDAPGQPLTMEKALTLADARLSGRPYVSAQDRLFDAYIAAKNAGQTDGEPAAPAAPQGRGILTDKTGKTQLLEPFTRLNEYRKRMIEEQDNGNY